MVMIANYQYGWTFFVPDIQKTFGWDRASIQWAFTLFVLFETWPKPGQRALAVPRQSVWRTA